jgi:hypothetical protein
MPPSPVRLERSVVDLLLEALRRRDGFAASLAAVDGTEARFSGSPETVAAQLAHSGWSEAEKQAMVRLAHGASIAAAAAAAEIAPEAVARAAQVLTLLGSLAPLVAEQEKAKDPALEVDHFAAPAKPPAAAAAPAAEVPAPSAAPEVQPEQIAAKLNQIQDADYFEILEVSRDASVTQIRNAHKTLKKRFCSPAVQAAWGEQMAAELEEIEAALDQAAAVLGHPHFGAAYKNALSFEDSSQER